MIDNADNYTEINAGSIITIKNTKYLVKTGFLIIYEHLVLYLDGATLELL